MVNQRRHAPVSRQRRASRVSANGVRATAEGPLARLQRGAEGVFSTDHGDRRRGGRFRWFVSTCFAAGIGAFAILFSLLGANDAGEPLQQLGLATAAPTVTTLPTAPQPQGLAWALPKGDKLVATSGAMSTKFIIYDSIHLRKDNREYLQKKTYARIIARLASAPAAVETDRIPPFNPYKLYATGDEGGGADALAAVEQQDMAVQVVELLGGILPSDDGQEMNTPEITEVVAREAAQTDLAALKPAFPADGAERLAGSQLLAQRSQRTVKEPLPPNTTALSKTVVDTDDNADDLEAREVRVFKVGRGDTLAKLLSKLNAEAWQIDEIPRTAKTVLGDAALTPGQEVHITLVPSVTRTGVNEVLRLSVFGDGQDHKLTVARRADGEFAASASPIDERIARNAMKSDDNASSANLYSSLFTAALSQGINPDTIVQILKIHASETDYRRRVRNSDGVEFFFGVKEEDKGTEGALGDLLVTSLTINGETQKYYRFRTPDGAVDFYDEYGNNSRKFLMRRPVRGDNIRLADGFGWRRHPILRTLRRHAGIDWAGPIGTPIMAAGAGVVEEAGRKGEFGNYIRIRHANGYKTAYAHLSRFAPGVVDNARVTQGQVIGFVGTTGLSTGPHLHYEVLINSQQVDPMTIPVPKERKLAGKALVDFSKERSRIDDLMRRNPVSTKVVEALTTK